MTSIPEGFWATAAQVIPTLLLVLVLERRFTRPDAGMPKNVMILFVTAMMLFATLAEFVALRNVALGRGSVGDAQLVLLSLGAMVTVIVSTFLFAYSAEHAKMTGSRLQRTASASVLLCVGAVSAAPVVIALWIASSL